MYNLYEHITGNPEFFPQCTSDGALIAHCNGSFPGQPVDVWSHYHYFVFVTSGQATWHTAQHQYQLRQGDCVLVLKGAAMIEQADDDIFCAQLIFLPDEFASGIVNDITKKVCHPQNNYRSVITIRNTEVTSLLAELNLKKFLLNIVIDPENILLLSCLCALNKMPRYVSLQVIMENNFCFNLSMRAFAQLCGRSLSAFRRDFIEVFQLTPSNWLAEKRLQLARHLLTVKEKTIAQTAFECGFASAFHFSRIFYSQFGFPPGILLSVYSNCM